MSRDTNVRHYLAILFGEKDITPQARKLLCTHFGLKEYTNEDVYQCPPTVNLLRTVAPMLMNAQNPMHTEHHPMHTAHHPMHTAHHPVDSAITGIHLDISILVCYNSFANSSMVVLVNFAMIFKLNPYTDIHSYPCTPSYKLRLKFSSQLIPSACLPIYIHSFNY